MVCDEDPTFGKPAIFGSVFSHELIDKGDDTMED